MATKTTQIKIVSKELTVVVHVTTPGNPKFQKTFDWLADATDYVADFTKNAILSGTNVTIKRIGF